MPSTAFTVVVPTREPAPLDASVTGSVAVLTRLPNASRTLTDSAGLNDAPATMFPGCCSNASVAAAPTVTSKLELATGTSDPLLAVSCLPIPALPIVSVPNVATPATALTVVVPTSDPVPVVTARLTGSVASVTRLPNTSRTLTASAGVNGAPAAMFAGCCSNASDAAAAAVTSNEALTACVRGSEVAKI